MRTTNPAKCGGLESTEDIVLTALKTVDGVDISVHAADLDAHRASHFGLLRTGVYTLGYPTAGFSTAAFGANILYAFPFLVGRAISIDRLAIQITGASGTLARLGIYNNGTNFYPGTLLIDAGSVATNGIAVVAATINPAQALTKGFYWLAIVLDGTPTLTFGAIDMTPLGQRATTLGTTEGRWTVAFNYAALPVSFPDGAAIGLSLSSVFARVASLD